MGIFDSTSETRLDSETSDRTFNAVSSGSSRTNSSAFGDIRITGGGKKSNTNATVNVTQTDFGAVKAGKELGIKGLDTAKGAFDKSLEAIMVQQDRASSNASRAIEQGLALASKSSAASVQDTVQSLTKTGLGIAAAFALVMIFRGA